MIRTLNPTSALIVQGQAIASYANLQIGNKTVEITIVEIERMFKNAKLENINGKGKDKTV